MFVLVNKCSSQVNCEYSIHFSTTMSVIGVLHTHTHTPYLSQGRSSVRHIISYGVSTPTDVTPKKQRNTKNYCSYYTSLFNCCLLNFLIIPFRLLTHYLPTRLAAQTQTTFSMQQIKTIPKNTFRLSASFFFILLLFLTT